VHGPLAETTKGFMQLDGSSSFRSAELEAIGVSPARVSRLSPTQANFEASPGPPDMVSQAEQLAVYAERSARHAASVAREVAERHEADVAKYAAELLAERTAQPAEEPTAKRIETRRATRFSAKDAWKRARPPLKMQFPELRNPHPLWRELPPEISTTRERVQANLFDHRRAKYEGKAKDQLHALSRTSKGGGLYAEDPRRVKAFNASINDMRRNRYVDMSRLSAPAAAIEPKKPHRKSIQAVSTTTWRLADSIWKMRPKWADSKSFYDDEACHDAAFSLDWSRALRSHRLALIIAKVDDGDGEESGSDADDDGDGIVDSEIVEVGNMLWKHHSLLYSIFDCFASLDAKTDISSVTYNAFKYFVQDCDLDVPGSHFCDSAHYDQLFIEINSPESSRKRASAPSVLITEVMGRRGMASDEAGRNDNKRTLSRHEWFNVLVRMAIMRFVHTKVHSVPSNPHLCSDLLMLANGVRAGGRRRLSCGSEAAP
jgi:hypothetical protein